MRHTRGGPLPFAQRANPMLSLPAVQRLVELDPVSKSVLRDILSDLQGDARGRADQSWARHKAPMAAYWAAVAVYAGHLSRCLGRKGGGRARSIRR